MRKQPADPLGLLLTLLLGGVLFAFINSCAAAYGAPCRQCVRQQAVLAPSLAYQPAVQYMIGQQVRAESVDVAAFRHSPEWQELQRLRAWKEGVRYGAQLRDQPAADVDPEPWTPKPEQPADDEALPLPGPLPEEPTGREPTPAPQGDRPFAGQMPNIIAACSKCHQGDTPKGDLWLDGTTDLRGVDAAEKRDAIVRMLLNERMPPSGHTLGDEQFNGILAELYQEDE